MASDISQVSDIGPVAENSSTKDDPQKALYTKLPDETELEQTVATGSPSEAAPAVSGDPAALNTPLPGETAPEHSVSPAHAPPAALKSIGLVKKQKDTAGGAIKTGDEGPHTPKGEKKQPCGCRKGGRNLVVCIDGTSNQFGIHNSNVVEFYSLIQKGDGPNQRTWYNSGIGTYAKPSWKSLAYLLRTISHKIDMAIAWNFERIVCGAYQWLSDNYESGDCIYLFGFSRGAYQVRVISAMIEKVGLIHKGNEMQIPFAYELYSRESDTELCNNFKKTFSRNDVKVHFVGAWDTVSSVGVIRPRHLLPGTADGMKHVCYFRHALALDERRVKFLPEYANGGLMKPAESPTVPPPATPLTPQPRSDLPPAQPTGLPSSAETLPAHEAPSQPKPWPMQGWVQMLLKQRTKPQTPPAQQSPIQPAHPTADSTANNTWTADVKEVWFAGTHSDIGGGNVENMDMARKLPPLRWMVSEATEAGLRMEKMRNEFLSLQRIDIIESLTGVWWLLEVLPIKHLAYTDQFSTTRRPHVGQGRTICDGQKIDLSVCLTKESWIPQARPTAGTDTDFDRLTIRHEIDGILSSPREEYPNFLEVNQYERARFMLLRRSKGSVKHLQISNSQLGSQWQEDLLSALIDLLLEQKSDEQLDIKILEACNTELSPVQIRRRQTDLVTASPLIRKLLSAERKENAETARQFLRRFTVPIIRTTKAVGCTVFSKCGKYVFHNGFDSYLRVSDVHTGEVVTEIEILDSVYNIAISSDGERLGCIVGLYAFVQTFIWNEELRQLSKRHTKSLGDVCVHIAFLPTQDPNQEEDIVVLADEDILVWNASNDAVELEGHTSQIECIVYSPRGDTMTAYSRHLGEFRVWNTATRKCLFTLPVSEDDFLIRGIACSTNGLLLAAGCKNGLIRVWDTSSRKESGTFRGHSGEVNSVQFSSDSKLLVSGSDDGTVKVWDVATCKLRETFFGHDDWVRSVAFSPDGKRIVSGGLDGTARVWDIEDIVPSTVEAPAPHE